MLVCCNLLNDKNTDEVNCETDFISKYFIRNALYKVKVLNSLAVLHSGLSHAMISSFANKLLTFLVTSHSTICNQSIFVSVTVYLLVTFYLLATHTLFACKSLASCSRVACKLLASSSRVARESPSWISPALVTLRLGCTIYAQNNFKPMYVNIHMHWYTYI